MNKKIIGAFLGLGTISIITISTTIVFAVESKNKKNPFSKMVDFENKTKEFEDKRYMKTNYNIKILSNDGNKNYSTYIKPKIENNLLIIKYDNNFSMNTKRHDWKFPSIIDLNKITSFSYDVSTTYKRINSGVIMHIKRLIKTEQEAKESMWYTSENNRYTKNIRGWKELVENNLGHENSASFYETIFDAENFLKKYYLPIKDGNEKMIDWNQFY